MRERGFTLIELLIVMIIIAILMAVAVPTYIAQKDNAQVTRAKQNIKLIISAATACSISNPNGDFNGSATGGVNCTDPAVLTGFEKGLDALEFSPNNLPPPDTYRIHDAPQWPIVVRAGLRIRSHQIWLHEYHEIDGTVHRECLPAASPGCPDSSRWG